MVFVAGEHPVYERHLSALTESAPSMTIRVVECSPAAGLGSRSCDCVCLMNDLMTLIRELMIQFACLPPRATFPRCFSLLSVTSSQLSFSKQLQRNISILSLNLLSLLHTIIHNICINASCPQILSFYLSRAIILPPFFLSLTPPQITSAKICHSASFSLSASV